MARYIDADDAAQRIMYYMSHTPERCGEHYAYKAALKEIVGSPTANVAEVKHGAWINGRYNDWKDNVYEEMCSVCGRYSQEYGKRYCPNCGAKMDGGKTE